MLDKLAEATRAAPAVAAAPISGPVARVGRRKRVPFAAAVGAFSVAVATVASAMAVRNTADNGVSVSAPKAVMRPAPTIRDLPAWVPQPSPTKRVTPALDHGVHLGRAVVDAGTLWAFSKGPAGSDIVVALDAHTFKPKGSVRLRLRPRYVSVGIAANGDRAWVLSQRFDGSPYVVTQIDSKKFVARRDIELPGPGAYGGTEPSSIVATRDAAWIRVGSLFRVDALTGEVSSSGLASPPQWMSAASDSLWMLFPQAEVTRLDLATNQIVRILTVGNLDLPWSLAVGDESVWVTGNEADAGEVVLRLYRIDPQTYDVTRFDLPAVQVAAGDGQVWVQLYDHDNGVLNRYGLIAQIDPETGKILRTIETTLRGPPVSGASMSIVRGRIWIGSTRISP